MTDTSAPEAQIPWLRRIAPAFVVFLLAPITAEYLSGYDTSTGQLSELLLGLLFLAPLYGAPALLIREFVRRTGRGWPAILLLSLAAGIVQAGLIDFSLFNPNYRAIPYWDSMRLPTLIPAIGTSGYMLLVFLIGHMIWSYSLPILLAEALVPDRATRPWLGWFGYSVMGVLYVLMSILIIYDHLINDPFIPSPFQFGLAVVSVLALIVAALFSKGPRLQHEDRAIPSAWQLGLITFVVLNGSLMVDIIIAMFGFSYSFDMNWSGVLTNFAMLSCLAVGIVYWSRAKAWSAYHVIAMGGAALLGRALQAFLIEPLGDSAFVTKLIHNSFMLIAVIGLICLCRSRAAKYQKQSVWPNS